jgi:hypothetical protein
MLQTIAWISLAIAFLCAAIIVVDEIRHPQKMMVMNFVWPLTALYLSVFALWAYVRMGRPRPHDAHAQQQEHAPSWRDAALSDTHCGAGCSLGDIVSEFGVFALGLTLFGTALYASYAADLAVAWLFGIVFQYFSIKPMSDLSSGQAIAAAIKADTLSILTFQVGMYLWMALVYFVLFPSPHLEPNRPAYWLMMQIAMICGYVTALPINLWLLRKGVKHPMH